MGDQNLRQCEFSRVAPLFSEQSLFEGRTEKEKVEENLALHLFSFTIGGDAFIKQMFQSVWSIFEKKLQCRVWCIHVAMKFLKRKGKEFCLNIFEVILGAFKVDPFLTLYYSANSLQSFYKSPTTDFISLLVCQASKCYFRDRVSYLRDHEKFCFLLIELQMKEGPFSAYFSHFGFAVVGTVLASSLHHFIQKINRLIDT